MSSIVEASNCIITNSPCRLKHFFFLLQTAMKLANMRRTCIYEMHSIKLCCLLCADGLMLLGYSKIGYRYLFFLTGLYSGAFICAYRPRPRLLSEARPLIESRSLFEVLRYVVYCKKFVNIYVNLRPSLYFSAPLFCTMR